MQIVCIAQYDFGSTNGDIHSYKYSETHDVIRILNCLNQFIYRIPGACLACEAKYDNEASCRLPLPDLLVPLTIPLSLTIFQSLKSYYTLIHYQNHGVLADCNHGMIIQLSAEDSRDA